MWQVMKNTEPSVFVKSNDEGVARVIKEYRNYAFFMESASIKYITHRECNLTQVGGYLDSKEYGIGMPISKAMNFILFIPILMNNNEYLNSIFHNRFTLSNDNQPSYSSTSRRWNNSKLNNEMVEN